MTTTDSTPAPAGTPVLGPITHVALTVRDLSVSVPFYRALTGSDPVLDEDTGPFRHVVFALGGTLLGLHQFPEGVEGDGFSPRRVGLDHIAFAAADRAELDAWVRRLEEEGIEHGEAVDASYGSGVAVKDPDGVALEVFCPPSS
jgi:catechol-2,3-dioxygenase